MTKRTTYTATFSDGTTITRSSHRTYTHAWLCHYRYVAKSGPHKGETFENKVHGFSGSRALAQKALNLGGGHLTILLEEVAEAVIATDSYRVVYGETMPSWEKIFPTMREAKAFAAEQKKFGDMIFSVKKVVPGEPAQSLAAAIEQNCVEEFCNGAALRAAGAR